MATMPIYGKTLKNLFSSTKKALRLNLGIQHWGLKVYLICSNDESRMTFDHFMIWSNCVPVAVAVLEDCCMAFANMQVNKLWPMGLLFISRDVNLFFFQLCDAAGTG